MNSEKSGGNAPGSSQIRHKKCVLLLGPEDWSRLAEELRGLGFQVAHASDPTDLRVHQHWCLAVVDASHPEVVASVVKRADRTVYFPVLAVNAPPQEFPRLLELGAILVPGLTGVEPLVRTVARWAEVACPPPEVEARLRLVEGIAWFGLYMLDAELKVTYVSPYICELLKRAGEEVVGQSVLEAIHPEDRPRVERVLREKLAGKEYPPHPVRLLKADQTPVWTEVYSRRVEIVGRPHIVGVVREVEAERRRQLIQTTLFRLVRELLTESEPKALLQRVADAIVEVGGFRRAVISLYDLNWPDPLDAPVQEVVTAGLTEEEKRRLLASGGMTPQHRRTYFSDEFRIGPEAYYIPYHKNPLEIEGTGLPGTVEMEGWSPLDLLFVPLRVEGMIIGHISLDDPVDPAAPTPSTLEPITHLAAVAALAVKRAYEEDLKLRHERHLKAAREMGRGLSQAASPGEVLQRAVAFIRGQLGYRFVGAGLLEGGKVSSFWHSVAGEVEPWDPPSSLEEWGPLARALEERAPQLLPRIGPDQPRCPAARRFELASVLLAPVFLEGEPKAFLVVGEQNPYALGKLDLGTIEYVASWCELTLDVLRMRERLAGLYDLAHSLAHVEDRKHLLQQVMQALRSRFEFDYCAFFRPVEGEMELEVIEVEEGIQLLPHIKPGWRLPKGKGVISWVAKERAPLLLADVRSYSDYVAGAPEVRSELAVPVLAGDELLGVLNVESRQPAAFGGDELAILQAVAGQLAVALQNLQSRKMLKELAIRDPLTGLYNRRFLDEVIGQEVAAARRYHRPLALLYVDVDGFRAVNNAYGHQMGDEILRRVAGFLQENVREADYVFRVGGDEFLILLPETDGEATGIAERLKRGIKQALEDVGLPLGLSIGVAMWDPESDFDLDALIAEADKKMYEDKKSSSRNPVQRDRGV